MKHHQTNKQTEVLNIKSLNSKYQQYTPASKTKTKNNTNLHTPLANLLILFLKTDMTETN